MIANMRPLLASFTTELLLTLPVASSGADVVRVSSRDELIQALRQAKPGTIRAHPDRRFTSPPARSSLSPQYQGVRPL